MRALTRARALVPLHHCRTQSATAAAAVVVVVVAVVVVVVLHSVRTFSS